MLRNTEFPNKNKKTIYSLCAKCKLNPSENNMTWEQKLEAIQNLCGEVSLRMRYPGNWYVSTRGRSFKKGPILYGSYGNGKTPQEAIENDWKICTTLTNGKDKYECIVLNDMEPEKRKHIKWNGYMWQETT